MEASPGPQVGAGRPGAGRRRAIPVGGPGDGRRQLDAHLGAREGRELPLGAASAHRSRCASRRRATTAGRGVGELLAYRAHSDAEKQRVLAAFKSVGLNEAARRTGVAKTTILRWAEEAGIDKKAVTEEITEKAHRGGAAICARTELKRAEERERIIDDLTKISRAALVREGQVVAAGGFTKEDLRQLTQARKEAVAQLELLSGRATHRIEQQKTMAYFFPKPLAVLNQALDALIPPEYHAEFRRWVAERLREVQDEEDRARLGLPPGDVVDAEEIEEAEVVEITGASA